MSPSRVLLLIAVLSACLVDVGGRAAAPPIRPARPLEPLLPAGAVARLGSTRLRDDREVSAIAFSPDSKRIASASTFGSMVRVWDVGTGRLLHEFDRRRLFPGEDGEHSFAFTSDGKMLAIEAGADVCFWDIRSGRVVRRFHGEGERVTALTFSTDGKTFFCGGEGNKLHQWDIASGERLRSWDYFGAKPPKRLASGSPDATASLKAVSPDGKTAVWAVTSWEEQGGTRFRAGERLALWDVATHKDRSLIKDEEGKDFGRAEHVVSSRDGKYLTAYEQNSEAIVWDAATGKKLRTLGPDIPSRRSRIPRTPAASSHSRAGSNSS